MKEIKLSKTVIIPMLQQQLQKDLDKSNIKIEKIEWTEKGIVIYTDE